MKDFAANNIRNFALVGHGSSGKTILSESMLLKSGEINRLGSIEAGSTVSDYHHDEHDRQISIHSSPLHLEWNETKFNLIDTPGYLDFIGETISSLAVVDAAIIVTGHEEFKNLDISIFNKMKSPILIDTRGIIDPSSAKNNNLIFRGLGRG